MPSKYKKSTKPKSSPTGKKSAPTGTDADLTLSNLSVIFADEDKAREFLEGKRWPDGKPVCPHCGQEGAYKLTSHGATEGKRPMRPGVWKCKACRKQFTVRVGTIFEESKLPLRKWLMAIHLMTSSKKGVRSHQIRRELDVSIKTAWFLTHRIRECMKLEPLAGMLQGVVEADECYIGGKPRPGANKEGRSLRGKGTDKTPVAVLVERDGVAICRPMENVTAKEMADFVLANVNRLSALMTDESHIYTTPGKKFYGGHHTTKHSRQEYARRENGFPIHSNTGESFFALLKRGHYGIFHQLSKQHLSRYCDEFSFRWKYRKVSDGHRMVALIGAVEGKRLRYKQPKP
jgi:transposase-like protein